MSHFQSIVQPRKETGVVCGGHMQFRSLVTNVSDAMRSALPQRAVCAPEYELKKMGWFLKNQTDINENQTQTLMAPAMENMVFQRPKWHF